MRHQDSELRGPSATPLARIMRDGSVKRMQPAEPSYSKVKDLNPSTKQVSLIAKVVSVGERRTIDSKFGGSRTLCEAVVGDETGTVILSLWEAQIGQAGSGDVLQVTGERGSLL